MKLYMNGKECFVDREQIPAMLEAGWSTSPELIVEITVEDIKPVEVVPVEKEAAEIEVAEETAKVVDKIQAARDKVASRRKKL